MRRYLHVVLENARATKGPVTHSALVGSLSGVDSSVYVEVARRREAFTTHVALVRFLSAVRQHVIA